MKEVKHTERCSQNPPSHECGEVSFDKHKNLGGSFNDFLKEEGIFEECTETAIKRVLAWQIENDQKWRGK